MSTDMATILQRASGIHGAIGRDLEGLGGFLRCETCKRVIEFYPGAQADYLHSGWPKCCGYTMRWWTQRQIDAGEVPPEVTQ